MKFASMKLRLKSLSKVPPYRIAKGNPKSIRLLERRVHNLGVKASQKINLQCLLEVVVSSEIKL